MNAVKLLETSSVMSILKEHLGIGEEYSVIISVWQREIGSEKVTLCGYKSGTLFAQAPSTAYINDLNLRKKQIIKKINQYLGKNLIKNIKCEVK
mgnify:CR=1 FL=1